MAKKVLGRDLADLLTRARPARLVERANARPEGAGVARGGSGPVPSPAIPVSPELPLDLPTEPTLAIPSSISESAAASLAPPLPGLAVGEERTHSIHRAAASPVFASRPMAPTVPVAEPGSRAWFYGLLAVDVVLLGFAAALFMWEIVPPPWSHRLALGAVVGGAVCAVLAYLIRPATSAPPPASKVRVQLRRV